MTAKCLFAASQFTPLYTLISIWLLWLSPELAKADVFLVHSSKELINAVKVSNRNGVSDEIILSKGAYNLSSRLTFSEASTTLRGATNNPVDVVISGKGMQHSQQVEILMDVNADNITISGITLQNVANHLIQVRAENDVDHFTLSNCILRDAYEQMLKVSGGKNPALPHADFGRVTFCTFEYSAGIGPQYYIGGIDAHRINHWEITHNTFRNIASPEQRVAEHAIHIWNSSSHNVVANNTIVNSDRGIGFGMGDRTDQNRGGIIELNTIVHSAKNHPAADVGSILESSPDTIIRNNFVYLSGKYPNAIEYRFKGTKGVEIYNNYTNKNIRSRNGGKAILHNNMIAK